MTPNKIVLITVILFLFNLNFAKAVSIIVAPHNASPTVKKRADLICDGVNDEVELLKSITDHAQKQSVEVYWAAEKPLKIECHAQHSVEWMPGNYILDAPLVIPNSSNCVIKAEGTRIEGAEENDAVIIRGMNNCRYYFGAIKCNKPINNNQAALKIKPNIDMPAVFSKVTYTSLHCERGKGIGLCVDSELASVCANEFKGTDVMNAHTGILANGVKACNMNWFWVSFIMHADECVYERGKNIGRNTWYVNVEASQPDSFGIRTSGSDDRWYIILGTADWFWRPEISKCKSIILDPGAKHNIIEVHPPLKVFAPVVDNSGNDTNVILTADRPPLSLAPEIKE